METKKTGTLLVIIFFIFSACHAQEKLKRDTSACTYEYDSTFKQNVYKWVDEMPEYLNGEQDQLRFFTENFHYPKDQEEFQGTIRLTFIVDTDGQIKEGKIHTRSNTAPSLVDKEALRMLSVMPKWKPGRCQGKKVPVRTYWVIRF